MRCVNCMYNLRGQRLSGRCPECGTPVLTSCTAPGTSGYAVASLVLGIVSIVGCVAYGLPSLVCGILAIVFANTARKQVVAGRASATSLGMAKAGRICGIIGLGIFLAVILMMFVLGISSS